MYYVELQVVHEAARQMSHREQAELYRLIDYKLGSVKRELRGIMFRRLFVSMAALIGVLVLIS